MGRSLISDKLLSTMEAQLSRLLDKKFRITCITPLFKERTLALTPQLTAHNNAVKEFSYRSAAPVSPLGTLARPTKTSGTPVLIDLSLLLITRSTLQTTMSILNAFKVELRK
jgi:hypothetical protein